MKYGERFEALSVPQWAAYNIDYNQLKNLIRVSTTRDQGQAIAIPGQVDPALAKFESAFYDELKIQHDRADLFVKSKADEISRRLDSYRGDFSRLQARCETGSGRPMSRKRREKLAKYDSRIASCSEDIRLLQKFVEAQRTAFQKILKKYKKWTRSSAFGERFSRQVLGNPKTFTRRDFESLLSKCSELASAVRAYTPETSGPSTPRERSLREIQVIPQAPQGYWNEYDNGSEVDHEEYTILVQPGSDSAFPGSGAISFLFNKAMMPVEKVKGWLSPPATPPERSPLLTNGTGGAGYFNSNTESELDDADTYSSDFPSGYATHYATFPSISDQKFARERQKLIMRGILGSLLAAVLLTAVAGVLVLAGRHRLRVEVDAGVFTGIAASLFFATMAFSGMLYEYKTIDVMYRWMVSLLFALICLLDSFIITLIASSTRL